MAPTTIKEVTGPPKRQAKEVELADSDDASDAGDSMEGWEATEPDAQSVPTSVDTDVDTDVDSTDREVDAENAAEAVDRQDCDLIAPEAIGVAAAIGAEDADGNAAAALGAEALPGAPTGAVVFWRNEYFFMSYHEQDIRIRIYHQWLSNEEMGARMASRSIRPAIYGEDARRCPKCTLVLRAWAVWRMALTDWPKRRPGRLRQVAADEAKVEADVRALGEADGLLDNAPLNGLLRTYIPNARRRLELAATAAPGAEQ